MRISKLCMVVAAFWSTGALACASAAASEPSPRIARESVSSVSYTTAKLNAEIAPRGLDTTYRFEYGLDSGYGTSEPVPDGTIASGWGETPAPVSVSLSGLRAGRQYHYRVVATSAGGTQYGADNVFTTYPYQQESGPESCPNAAYRVALSASLPDCRAYELVSPVDKNGGDVLSVDKRSFAASASGDRVEYVTRTPMGETTGSGAAGFSQYIASRTVGGWTSKGILPTPAFNSPLQFEGAQTEADVFSEELDRAVVRAYALPGVEGAIPKGENLYLEDTLDGGLSALTTPTIPGETFVNPLTESYESGISADLGVVVFESVLNLVPGAKGVTKKLYAMDKGKIELVGVLPDETIAPKDVVNPRYTPGSFPFYTSLPYDDTVSRDGARIYFLSPAPPAAQLYLRREGKTAWVSEPEIPGVKFQPHGVSFQGATPDGRKVVFTSEEPLLDADPGGGGVGLYMYTDSPEPQSEPNLSFIARVANSSAIVVGLSDDGTYVYYQSLGSYYLWNDGGVRLISSGDRGEEARVSKDGTTFAFMSPDPVTSREVRLASYLNKTEMYVYDASGGTLSCVSCPPSGATATVGIEPHPVYGTNPGFDVPGLRRFLSADGHYVFFDTPEALLPQDTNGVADAYEYDTYTNTLSLLSTGTGESESWFVEADPSGENVFITTKQRLTGWDEDTLNDLYDVRVDGGLPGPPPPPVPCEGDECQGVPAAVPSFTTASGFTGLGNQAPAPKSSSTRVKKLTRAQKLVRALAECRREPKRKRARCRVVAHKRFASQSTVKRTARRAGR